MDARLAGGPGRHRSGPIDESARCGRREIGSRPGSPILFIVNPSSGAGKAGREWTAVESWLPTSGLPYEVALTTRPLDATEIAQKAVHEERPVEEAMEGDRNRNEVGNAPGHKGRPLP